MDKAASRIRLLLTGGYGSQFEYKLEEESITI